MNMEIIREKIGSLEFRMLSPKMIKKMAVVKIITPELYDADGYPVDGGLMDIRMGVIDPGLRCRSCGSRVKECPGHFGFIELARPVLHIKYIPQIADILRCTCWECSKLLMSDQTVSTWRKKLKRIEKTKGILEKWKTVGTIIKRCKNITKCPHCGAKQNKIKLDKPSTFYRDGIKLTPIDIRERLERVSEDNLEMLGIDPLAGRPEWMVLTLLPVPPVTVRPSITLESGQRSEDDLTHKLGDIVRTNQRLFENLSAGAPQLIIDDLWDLLQYHVTTFFVNNISQIPPARHRSGRPLKTLAERIKSKEGRFRRNLAGKRVDYSSRTVISPDSNIRPDEVGVPDVVAKELTVPERVTEWNKKHLLQLIKNGPEVYPGANYVITLDGKRKRVMEETKETILKELEPGYIVERHIVDGDIAIFNRQPSLHKMSMMGHFIKVLPYKTFRINPCTTTPYNADFDGDEMNLHVPQTEEARAESRMLMGVGEQIITPRYGLPIIGANEDHISGCFILTQKDRVLTKKQTAHLMSLVGYEGEIPDVKGDVYTGKQVFSMLLPSDFNYEGKSRQCNKHKDCLKEKCESDAYVCIKKGQMISGVIDKNAIGAGGGKLFNAYLKQYGPEKALDFLQKVALLGIGVLDTFGFTVLPSDTDLPQSAVKEIKAILNDAEADALLLIERYKRRDMQPYPGRTMRETLESNIMNVLNRARNKISKIVERHSTEGENFTMTMANSGARGSPLNLALIAACVGQTALRGSRIVKGYSGRVLPHFLSGDLGPTAHGFIKHGYKAGLNPFEFFFHSIAGRDSMMDTSMRTPKSGYMQRRLVTALQDLKSYYDGTVRDAEGNVIQFSYGDDNIDITKPVTEPFDVEKIKERVDDGKTSK